MSGFLEGFVLFAQYALLAYFLALNSTYTLLIIFALRDIVKHSYMVTSLSARRLLAADAYYKPVSVIVPAHNEAEVIVQSVRALLNLHYPEFEVIVVNDGSADATLERLKAEFRLRPTSKPVRLQVPHEPIKAVYISQDYGNLIVADKANGGKADAINAGINISSYPLFCSIDADSLLEPDAVLKSTKLFLEDDELIATGGIVRILNGCEVKDGAVLSIGLPGGTVEALQVLEYTRAFLSGRTGWNLLKSLLIISGAFGVFRKDMVVAVNGYRKTVGEDMDLVMRLHRHCLDNAIPYKILFVPDPVCWTQAPFGLAQLRRQRNRWHRGLIDCLVANRAMILNPKYGKVSLLGVSYFLFAEAAGPLIEAFGYVAIPLLWLTGHLGTEFLLLLTTVGVLWGISINIAAIFLDTYNYRRYNKESDILRLCLLSVVEFLGYRQINLWERVKATFSFRNKGWGRQERLGLQGSAAPEQTLLARALARVEASALAGAASRFLTKLPALLLALLLLRLGELAGGLQPGTTFAQAAVIAETALRLDLAALARHLPLLFLYSLPLLLLPWRRTGDWALNFAWALLVVAQGALVQYFLTARVPLGSDLLAYSWQEILTAARGGLPINLPTMVGTLLGFAGFTAALELQRRRGRPLVKPLAAAALLAASLGALLLPPRPQYDGKGSEDTYNLTLNKPAFLLDDSVAYLASSFRRGATETAAAGPGNFRYLDPAYPFLRAEQTPDILGPLFDIKPGPPPSLVFVFIEGLGRSFSGPGAALGSFTPNLDRLAGQGLYWENFLAAQGRTFSIFPSVFASAPFGANGLAELGDRIPPHDSLLSVLKARGYRLGGYAGFNLDFDNYRAYLRAQGVADLTDETNFGPGYSVANSWGYSDGDLFKRALAGLLAAGPGPSVSFIKTATMHTPYTFPGQEKYYPVFERRLDELGISEGRKETYRAYRDIYASILYNDDAVGKFFEGMKKHPDYANTIFIVTADHRLPEIPMASRIDRYHVPLLIWSPLLKAPASVKSVSSHFDIAPSLLAFLSKNYGVPTPQAVAWLGSGLDMEPAFRNVHSFAMKQTKTNLVDFASGAWFLNQDTLYALGDGMAIEPADDEAALAAVKRDFAAFRAANAQLERANALVPPGAVGRYGPYREEDRLAPAPPSARAGLAVREARCPATVPAGDFEVEVVLDNNSSKDSGKFVPLAVLLAEDGTEVLEGYGPLLELGGHRPATATIKLAAAKLPPGRYFLSVFPSDPATGKKSGGGRYRIPVTLAAPPK